VSGKYLSMLLKWLSKRWEEATAGTLLLLSTALLRLFGDSIAAVTATISYTPLLLQLLAWSTISCGYLGWKFHRLKKRTRSEEVVRYHSGVEFRCGPKTGRHWAAFCPACHDPLHPREDRYESHFPCPAMCGWNSSISEREVMEILANAKDT